MTTVYETKRPRIALFLDIENLIGGASTMGLPIEIEAVLQNLKTHGSIPVRKCFGDIHRCMQSVGRASEINYIRKMLHRHLVQIEDVPFVTANKNTADIRLVIDALSLAYQYEDLTHFAVVASDRDYVPLFNKLHELGRTVISVSIDRDHTNSMLLEASDILVYYDSFFQNKIEQKSDVDDEESALAIEPFFDVLRQSLQMIANSGVPAVGSAVASSMGQLRSDFSPQLVGCNGFREFIVRAETAGIVKVLWAKKDSDDFTITLCPPKSLLSKTVVLQQPEKRSEYGDIASDYKNLIESRLNIPFPNHSERIAILDALKEAYDRLVEQGSFSLSEMSEEASEHLRKSNGGPVPPQSVFKIALSLYFSRCFHCGERQDQFNPTIVGKAVGNEEWEQRLYMSFVRVIKSLSHGKNPLVKPLCALFFESEGEEDLVKTEQIIDETRWN